MLAHPDFIYISIDTYKWEIFPTFMLADGDIYNFSVELSKGGSNIQHSM